MWVRSEYAGELAVLSAWLCALLPWSVSYATPGDVEVFRIHFPYLLFQFVPGVDLGQGRRGPGATRTTLWSPPRSMLSPDPVVPTPVNALARHV